MTNSEIVKKYVLYCFNFVPHVQTRRGEMPLAIFKLDHVNVETIHGTNCISFDLIDDYGLMSASPDSFFERAFNPYGVNDVGINRIVMKGIILMKTGYIHLADIFNGHWSYDKIPENIQNFDEYVEHLEDLGIKEKPKGLLKIPAHMMIG